MGPEQQQQLQEATSELIRGYYEARSTVGGQAWLQVHGDAGLFAAAELEALAALFGMTLGQHPLGDDTVETFIEKVRRYRAERQRQEGAGDGGQS